MSRIIKDASHHVTFPSASTCGKILFTRYEQKQCAMYVNANRLLAVQVLQEHTCSIGAIYVGKVKNAVSNLSAYFVEIGEGQICFLQQKDVVDCALLNRPYDGRLIAGDEVLVQVIREPQKTKQAAVSCKISISNEVAAVTLGNLGIGYSSKLGDSKKKAYRQLFAKQNLFSNLDSVKIGVVIRTMADQYPFDKLLEQVIALRDELLQLLDQAKHRTCFSCIKEPLKEYENVLEHIAYPYEYEEVITDDPILFEKLNAYCLQKHPDKTVRLYEDENFTLSKLYGLGQKMDSALCRRIWLKSGANIIIDVAEALTVIDVNTGKYEAKKASQAAYEKINREAAEEIAVQLRLRNLSGIIVVDFINLEDKEAREQLLQYLRNLVKADRVQTTVVDMTPLGLVEITRKKENKPLREHFIASPQGE